jgi:thioredoxin reductase
MIAVVIVGGFIAGGNGAVFAGAALLATLIVVAFVLSFIRGWKERDALR